MSPFQVPDEPSHWMAGLGRIHQLVRPGEPLCSTEVAYFNHYGIHPGHRHPSPPPGTLAAACGEFQVSYGGVLSYPQLWVAHALHGFWSSRPDLTLRVARLVSGMLILGALALSLRSALASGHPASVIGVLWAGLLLMSPVGIQQSFAVSSDGVGLGFAILMASLLHSAAHWRRLDWAAFAFFGVCAVTTKPVVAPLIAIVFFMKGVLRQGWQRLMMLGLLLLGIFSGIFSAVWSSSSPNADSIAQKAFVLDHPFQVLGMLIKAAFVRAMPYTQWLVARLGWFDHKTSHLFLAIYFSAFVALTVLVWKLWSVRPAGQTGQSQAFGRCARHFLFLSLWVGSVSLIGLIMYLTYSTPGAAQISGMQGRYILPLHMIAVGYLAASWKEVRSEQPGEAEQLERGVRRVFVLHAAAMVGVAVDLFGFYG